MKSFHNRRDSAIRGAKRKRVSVSLACVNAAEMGPEKCRREKRASRMGNNIGRGGMSRPPPPSGEGPGASDAADDVPYVDTLVREYLLYRGCSGALAAFDAERGEGQAFDRADRVAELIFGRHVPRLDAVGLSRTLGLLRDRYFSRLDASFAPATAELETSIARLFVVTAAKARRKDKIAELFEAEGERLVAASAGGDEWHRWFAVPYVKRPSNDPRFAPYFEDTWADAVVASARNFLSVAFAAAPEPAVLRFGAARRERALLVNRVAALEREVALLRENKRHEGVSLDAARTVDTTEGDGVNSASRGASGEDAEAASEDPFDRVIVADGRSGLKDSDKSASSSFEMAVPRDRHRDKNIRDPHHMRDAVTAVTFTRQDAFSLHAPRPVAHARFAPGGALAAGAGDDGAIRVWSVDDDARDTHFSLQNGVNDGVNTNHTDSTTSVLASLHVGENAVGALAWDVDAFNRNAREGAGGVLYVGTRDASVRAWDVDERAVVADAAGDESFPHCEDLRCSPCGRWLARSAATRDPWARAGPGGARRSPLGRVEVWDARALTCVASLPLGAAAPCAHELAFNHNGKMLAAAGADGEIRLFDVNAARLVAKWRAHPKGHAATSVAFSSSAADACVFGVGTDGVVAEWSLRSLRASLGAVDVRDVCGVDTRTRLALDPAGRGVALTSAVANGAVAVLERRDGNRAAANDGDAAPSKAPSGARGGQAVSLPGNGAAARCVDWHPTRSAVLAGCVDGTSMLTTLEMSVSEG